MNYLIATAQPAAKTGSGKKSRNKKPIAINSLPPKVFQASTFLPPPRDRVFALFFLWGKT
jgi:hypothetical protein